MKCESFAPNRLEEFLFLRSLRQPTRHPHHGLLQHVLEDLQNEASAWPFLKPVDEKDVADYYNVIKNPMGELAPLAPLLSIPFSSLSDMMLVSLTCLDLATMESKLENNHYDTIESFIADAKLIFENCWQYNGKDGNTYSVQATRLDKALTRILKQRQANIV